MSFIPEEQLDEIKSRLDIVQIIGEQLPLKRAGQNWKGCCPFHDEKTASFIVSPEKQIYHCFGCGEGGNLFSFIMKHEGLGFVETVEKLAQRAGVVLAKHKAEAQVNQDEKQLWLRMNRFAQRFFEKQLKESPLGQPARDYLQKRGISAETAAQFGLGYAPPGFDNLASLLQARQIPLDYALTVGLLRQREDGRTYDFFRDRLIFPIIDPQGGVIGFGGRILVDQPDQAKYINSSESPLYHKSDSIFGLDQARTSIRQNDCVILVEGYLDQITLFQAGIQNVVAPLGTALTEAQIRKLARLSQHFILLFDGDEAGEKAASRSLPLFLKLGLSPKKASLPDQLDPDSFIRERGVGALRSLLAQALPLLEHQMTLATRHVEPTLQGKIESARLIFPYLQILQDNIEKDLYIQRLASFLQIEEGLIRKELGRFSKKDATFGSSSADGKGQLGVLGPDIDPKRLPRLEKEIYQFVLSGKEVPASFFSKVDESDFSDRSLQALWQPVSDVGRRAGHVLIAPLLDLIEDEPLKKLAVSLAVDLTLGEDDFKMAFAQCEAKIMKRRRQKELQWLTHEIRLAEEKQDESALADLVTQKNNLMKEEQTFQIDSRGGSL